MEDTTQALKWKAENGKARMRRAKAFEELDKLLEALEDWKEIVAKEPENETARKNVRRLEPIVKVRTEKQKEEMMSKLKDMGNSLLGKFGMSLDNFKAQQDPNTGSYNISFQK